MKVLIPADEIILVKQKEMSRYSEMNTRTQIKILYQQRSSRDFPELMYSFCVSVGNPIVNSF